MNKLDLKKFNWYGFKHSEVLKRYNQSNYVGTFCLKGNYKPYVVYRADSPDLEKGVHTFRIDYFQAAGNQSLILKMNGEVISKELFYR